MIVLPDRYTDFPPIATDPHSFRDVILPREAYASIWMRPHLLGWHKPIHWLPPLAVDSRRKTKGDLWGLDSKGNLLIVETKLDRGASLKDPFGSLLQYLQRKVRDHAWSAKELRARWLESFASEKKFVESEIAMLWSLEQLTGIYSSTVPYSLDRDDVLRSLCCTIAARTILSRGHERAIDRALRAREAAGNPPPFFASLVASTRDDFQLSIEGRRNLRLLQKYADPSRVILRAMNGTRGSKVLRIFCWSPIIACLS